MLIPLAQETIIELRGIGMDIFSVLNLIGGLCLFLFGMNLMGQALERRVMSCSITIQNNSANEDWSMTFAFMAFWDIVSISRNNG